MNTRKSLYDVASFYNKKAVLDASYQGMRYQVEQSASGEEKVLLATVWPEPFCFDKTPDDKKEKKIFQYSEEGLDEVYEWLCCTYKGRKEEWQAAAEQAYIM